MASAFVRPIAVRVWAGISDERPCKFCHKTIVWRTRMDTGKTLPFDPSFTVREVGRDAKLQVYHLLAFADVHKCAARPKPTPKTPRLF